MDIKDAYKQMQDEAIVTLHHQIKFNEFMKYPIAVQNITFLSEETFAKVRSDYFGASDSAVLLRVAYHKDGKNPVPMKTVEELLTEKINETIDEDIAAKASVRKGKDLENLLIDKIKNKIHILNEKVGVIKPVHMYHNNYGLSVNFDGIMCLPNEKYIPLEIKVCTVWARKNYDWDKAITEDMFEHEGYYPRLQEFFFKEPEVDSAPIRRINLASEIEAYANIYGIPAYYYTQIQQQMYFANSNYGILAVMDDTNWIVNYFKIPRNEVVIKHLLDISYAQYIILATKKKKPYLVKEDNSDV